MVKLWFCFCVLSVSNSMALMYEYLKQYCTFNGKNSQINNKENIGYFNDSVTDFLSYNYLHLFTKIYYIVYENVKINNN